MSTTEPQPVGGPPEPTAGQTFVQRLAVDLLLDHVGLALELAGVDHVDHVGVRELGEGLLLAHELRNPLAPLRNGLEVLRLAGAAARSEIDYFAMVSAGTLLKRVADPAEIVGPVLRPV